MKAEREAAEAEREQQRIEAEQLRLQQEVEEQRELMQARAASNLRQSRDPSPSGDTSSRRFGAEWSSNVDDDGWGNLENPTWSGLQGGKDWQTSAATKSNDAKVGDRFAKEVSISRGPSTDSSADQVDCSSSCSFSCLTNAHLSE